MSEEITLKIKKENIWKYSTFVLLAVVVIGIIVMVAGGNGGSNNNQQTITQGNTEANTVEVDFEQVIDDETPTIGSDDAPITILEFTDFSCPYCAAASGDNAAYVAYMQQNQPGWEAPVSNVIDEYVESGKVKFAVFYTPGHSGGAPAQIVSWCLNDQDPDLYWQFYSKAFANIDDVEDAAKMRALAGTISGVDTDALDECIDSGKFDSRFDEEQAKGAQLGMSGTPGFVIGKSDGSDEASIVRGAYPYSTFQQLIDARL